VRTIGAELVVRITAEDNASARIQAVGKNAQETGKNIEVMGGKAETSGRKVTASARDAAVGFSGMATAGFVLYGALDRIGDMQVAVDRANYMVKVSTNAVEKAQLDYNAAVTKYGPDSAEAKAKAEELSLAQEKLQISTDRARMTQDNQNEAMMGAALTVVPSMITMVSNLHRTFESFAGLKTSFVSRVGDMTISLKANAGAWTSVFMAMAGIGLIIGAFTSSSIELRVALAALGAVLVVLAIRQWAMNSAAAFGVIVSSWGLMTWVVIAAIAAAALVAAAALTYTPAAKGGIFRGPTTVLVGEAGRELIADVRDVSSGEIVATPTLTELGRSGTQAVIPLAAGGTIVGPIHRSVAGGGGTTIYNYENHFHITASDPDVVMNKVVREFRRRVGAGQ
jgi:hypothetical protein